MGGARTRGSTPRRRLEMISGMRVSPAPKRPAAYQVPGPACGPPMDIEAVVAELYVQRAAFSSLHEWVTSIFESSTDHAAQIDAAGKQF